MQASFPSLPPPRDALNASSAAALHIVKESTDGENTTYQCQTGDRQYTSAGQAREPTAQYFIGIRPHGQNTIQLIPLDSQPLRLAPVFTRDVKEEEQRPTSHFEARTRLTETFASERQRRQLSKRMVTRITTDMSHDVELETAQVEDSELVFAGEEELTRLLPPFDLKATDPVHAYPIDQLIPDDILDTLTEESYGQLLEAAGNSEALTSLQQNEDGYYYMTTLCLAYTLGKVPESERELYAKRIFILNTLLWFNRMRPTDLNKKGGIREKIQYVPTPVIGWLVRSFTDNSIAPSGRSILQFSRQSREKILNYMCVLLMHCSKGFTGSAFTLAQDLRKDLAELHKRFKFLGFTVSMSRQSSDKQQESIFDVKAPDVIRLKAPLKLPVLETMGPTNSSDADGRRKFRNRRQIHNMNGDADQGGQVVQQERISDLELRELFSLIDLDGSGDIDSDEILALLRQLGLQRTEEDVQKMLADVDTDGGGSIDFDEFRIVASTTVSEAKIASALRHFNILANYPRHHFISDAQQLGTGRLDIETLEKQLTLYAANDAPQQSPVTRRNQQFNSEEIHDLMTVMTGGRDHGNFNYNTFLNSLATF